MGKDLKGKELGVGISQEKNGLYSARFVDRFGKRQHKRFKKLQECRQWIAEAQFLDEHCDLNVPNDMIVDAWFEYWIDLKKKIVRPNTSRNYTERYQRNIKPVIGNMKLVDVKPIHCQKIMNDMADEGYKTTTIYQTRIALYNMLEFAKENDVITNNPCKKSVKSDIGKESEKKEALTIETQRKFLEYATGNSYEDQFRFVLQTGLRTGELVGLRWEDIDFKNKKMKITRTMEYRYSVIPIEWVNQVFLCKRLGTPVKNSTYNTALFKICDKAGIKHFSMHVLRHTFATRCIEAGMKPKTLQMLLGHSNIGITMNLYVHTTEEEKLKEIELVAEALKVI